MSFYEWLLRQKRRDDFIGDLACDAERDWGRPSGEDTLEQWIDHLKSMGACPEALEALDEAWAEYRVAQKMAKT